MTHETQDIPSPSLGWKTDGPRSIRCVGIALRGAGSCGSAWPGCLSSHHAQLKLVVVYMLSFCPGELLEDFPEDPDARYWRGKALLRLGRHCDAEKQFDEGPAAQGWPSFARYLAC